MGLDQYAYRIKEGQGFEIAYWRKHNRLQGWMENLWVEKGMPNPQKDEAGNPIYEFNCVDLEIDWEDIIQLTEAIDNRNLPATAGFFFGRDSYSWHSSNYQSDNGDYENLNDDLEFIEIAKIALDAGDKVIYSSWW